MTAEERFAEVGKIFAIGILRVREPSPRNARTGKPSVSLSVKAKVFVVLHLVSYFQNGSPPAAF
jgi:hypothetical protein